jgi:hypothetical protein
MNSIWGLLDVDVDVDVDVDGIIGPWLRTWVIASLRGNVGCGGS